MSNQIAIIEKTIKSPQVMERLSFALNLDPNDERAKSKAMSCAASVLAEIKKTAGDPKKDLTTCQPDSIAQAMIDAAQFGLQIDGRQHAYLIKYGNRATFQPGYRAYIYKIKEAYPDANIIIEPIFDGDNFKIIDDGGSQSYMHERKDAFCTDPNKLKGVMVAVQYTDNGRLVKRAIAVPKERIDRARRAAKQDFIWKSDYIEKAKAAAVKNAFKYMFVALQGLQEMIGYDNREHYNATPKEQPASAQRDSVVDNLNANIRGDEGIIDADFEDVDEGFISGLLSEIQSAETEDVLEEAGAKIAQAGLNDDQKAPLKSEYAAKLRTLKEAVITQYDEEELSI